MAGRILPKFYMLSLFLVSLFLIAGVLSVNPGAKIQVSQRGLQYGAQVAVDILATSAQKAKIPDQRGQTHAAGGKVDYEVTNIRVTNFQKPQASIRLDVGKGLTLSFSNLNIGIHGDWHYKYRKGIIKISDHGTFDGSVSGGAGSVSVTLGQNPTTGGLTISSTGCSVQIQSLRIKIHGGLSWFYNLFHKNIEKPIRNGLEKIVCEQARKAIDIDASKELATMPVSVIIGKQWLLDYRLVAPPAFTQAYLGSFHKAELFHVNDKTEAPFQADAIPDAPPVDRMVTIWLSDYILNSAGFALYKRGALKRTVTANDLPAEYKGYMDTTCRTTSLCFGSMLPEVRKLYPNATVELEVTASESPKALIASSSIEGRGFGIVNVNARLANQSLAYLFTANVTANISIVPGFDGERIKGKVERLKPSITVTKSAVGPITSAGLTLIFDIISQHFIVPKLNEVGESGFPLPVIKHVKFLNANLTPTAHALCITADIQYSR